MRQPALGDFYAHMRKQFVVESHFEDEVFTTVKMKKVVDAAATAAVSATIAGGAMELDTPATDNLAALAHVTAPINLTEGVCALFAARVKFEDAGSNAANLMIALSDEVGLDQMQDDGAGIDSDMNGAGFYSLDGSAELGVFYSKGTTQTTNLLTKAASRTDSAINASYVDGSGDPKYRTLEIEIKCKTTTKCDVTYKIDGVAVYQLLDETYTDGTDVKGLIFVKNGTAAAQKVTADAFVQAATFDDVA